jgi:hypothetical protein
MSKMGFLMAKLTVIPEDFLRKVKSHKKITVAVVTHRYMIHLKDWHGEEYPPNICIAMPSPAYPYYKHNLFFLIDT